METQNLILSIAEKEECFRAKVYMKDFTSNFKPVRLGALGQIKKLSKPVSRAVLKKLLAQESNRQKQIEVLGAFATCYGKLDGDRGFLKSYLLHVNPDVRLAALRVISKYEDDESFEILSLAIKDPQADIRQEAIKLICKIYGERALPLILHLLHDLNDKVRKAAITFSSAFETNQAVPILITMLTDNNVEIQKDVQQALKKITKHDIEFDINGSQASKTKAIKEWNFWWMNQYDKSR